MLDITEKIKQGCDSGKMLAGYSLIYKKVFDTGNHDIFLKKTIEGIRGVTNY